MASTSLLGSLSIRARVLVIATIPVLGLLGLTGLTWFTSTRTQTEIVALDASTRLLSQVYDLRAAIRATNAEAERFAGSGGGKEPEERFRAALQAAARTAEAVKTIGGSVEPAGGGHPLGPGRTCASFSPVRRAGGDPGAHGA